MDLQLKDQVVFITGPAKGMGRAISLAFAREGAKLALAGRDTAAIEPVAAEARALGVEAIVLGCDITSDTQTDATVAQTLARFGKVDVLVSNAAYQMTRERRCMLPIRCATAREGEAPEPACARLLACEHVPGA